MIDLTKLPLIIQKREADTKDSPKHIILNLFPIKTSEEKEKEDFRKVITILDQVVDLQREKNLPILTVSLGKIEDIYDTRALADYCEEKLLEKAIEHKINVTIFGRWYDVKGELVTALKKINNETNDFDHFFLNICINYDGKREIADACRVIIRKILMEKSDIDAIDPEMIKENIYSSYLMPPDMIIEPLPKFTGTFLWDSAGSKIYKLNKSVLDLSKADVAKAFDWYMTIKH